MGQTQNNPIGNTVIPSIVQKNFEELYETAHEHMIRDTVPAGNEGAPRDIVLFDDGTTVYLYIKTTRGWFRTAALTPV